jgi:hypothetical protein
MARLPDANVLGGLPSANSGRQISSIDGSGIGQGMQNMASGMRALAQGQEAQGQGIARGAQAVARGIDEFAKEQERNALVKETLLDGERNIERMKLSERISTENNPDTIAELRSGFAKIDETFAAKIPDPQRRALAMNKWQQQTAGSVIDTNARHRTLYNNTVTASADNLIEEQRRKAVTSTDPKVRQQAIDEVNGQFDRLFQAGIIKNPEELKQRKRKFADDYSFDRFQMLTPQERYESSQPVNVGERSKAAYGFFQGRNWTPAQAAGIVGNLIHESVGLNTGARNPGDGRDGSDSVGLAQWNSTRAVALKAFAAQNKADWRDFNIQLAFVQNELETSEAPAARRLREAKTPREAAAAFAEYFLRPEGAGRGNPEGIHGFANRAKQAEAVASKFGGMKIEPTEGDRLYAMLPPERQMQARESSARDLSRETQAFERQQREVATETKRTIADDLASIEATGKEVDGLTRDRVSSVLGEEGARDWEADRTRARRVYSALNGIETLSEGEVEQRLKTLEPTPGAEGFADDMRTYRRAEEKTRKFLEARRADPALSVDAFETVRQVRAAAEYDGEGDRKSIKPESAQSIVRARLAAQSQLGIPEPMAVTRSEARTIARQLRYIGDEDAKGMERFVRQLQGTYGDLADEVLTSALQLDNVSRDLAVLATQVINSIAVGKVPDIASARRMDVAIDNQNMEGAMAGIRSGLTTVDARQAAILREGQTGKSAKPGEAEPVTFDSEDIRWLDKNRANPDAALSFDNKYGPKMAQRILADIDRRKGVQK